MKKLKYISILFLVVGVLSCKKDLTSEGVSTTTSYVTFSLTDGDLVTYPKGNAYVDPGFKALEGTTDVTNKVTIEGTVDGTKTGLYNLTYTAINSDGFSASISRTVIIYDPTSPSTDLTGSYLSMVSRVAPARSFSNLSVSIKKVAPGFFYVSDFLGGFYDQGSNYKYGSAYAMTGYMVLNADNSFSLISSHLSAWADELTDLLNGTYDPVTSALSWESVYTSSNYHFLVSLAKQ